MSSSAPTARAAWTLILAASAILMITMAARLTTGLFLSPLNTATGLGVASISFAMAVGQFMWGASQPVFGAVADKYGSARVIVLRTRGTQSNGVVVYRGRAVRFRDVSPRRCTAYRYTIVNYDRHGHRSTGVPTSVVTRCS